ncbi:glycosyltransferase family 4 protein [Candidatus Pacearchaeota archaeon]|nr:glycosyltransferase family 4 protein [Candidatus Pacearchaeota archaeon]
MNLKNMTFVFSESYSTVMVYKLSKILKEKGYNTVQVRILEQNKEDNEFYRNGFNNVIDFNIPHFQISSSSKISKLFGILKIIKRFPSILKASFQILKLRNVIYVGRSKVNLPVYLFRKTFFRNVSFIFFPYDLRNHKPLSENLNVPKFELFSEKYCLEKCDGLIHKGAPEELDSKYMDNRSLGKKPKIQKLRLNIHPYCSKEFIVPINKNKLSKKDKEWHFCYVGGIKKSTNEFYDSLLDFDWLLKHKVHIHFYFCSDTKKEADIKKDKEVIKSFYNRNKNYSYLKYIHFHDALNPKELAQEISKYDIGIIGDPVGMTKDNFDPVLTTANKISSYFEAGIPFLYSKKYMFLHRLMKGYSIDLGYNDINKINDILKKINYKDLEKNVEKARGDFLFENHLKRIEDFFKNVLISTKRKY